MKFLKESKSQKIFFVLFWGRGRGGGVFFAGVTGARVSELFYKDS